MRGMLLVALGAALIWLGLTRGGSSSAAGPDDTAGANADYASQALDGAPRVAATARDAAPRGAEVAHAPPDGGDADAARRGDGNTVQDPAPRPETEERPTRTPEAPPSTAPATAPPPAVDLAFGGNRGAQPTPGSGGGAPTLEALARLLVSSWIDEDAAALEGFIRDGDGARLSVGHRQLVASFWQACMGETERAASQIERLRADAEIGIEHVALLEAALGAPGARKVPFSAGARDPLERAMRMVLAEDEGRASLERQDYARAAASYSDLIHLELGAPWAPQHPALVEWGAALERAQARHRLSRDGTWPGVEYVVRPNDSLTAIRKRVVGAHAGLLLCTGLMAEVNDIRNEHIRPGETLRFPTDVANVVVDLDARVVVFRLGSEAVRLWPVGIGKEGHETPIGVFQVGEGLKDPAYMPEGMPPLPFGHADNPLGTRWIPWLKDGRNTSIGFHGTSKPDGVGGRVSQGCIRMRNEDVEELFVLLPRDARIVVQP
jgi:hypothetical protein